MFALRSGHAHPRTSEPRTSENEVHRILDDLTATLGHELNTPLAIVETAAETLLARRAALSDDQVEHLLHMVERNARLAVALVRRLSLARQIDAGTIELDLEPVDLAEVVTQTVSDLDPGLLAHRLTGITVDDRPTVPADATALREILLNLLSNAVKYSEPDAPIELRVGAEDDTAVVVVRDHGEGIPEELAETIFSKYERAGAKGPGAGLGLYVSRGLARAHGGDLRVRPAPGEGSEFVLTLPVPD